MDKLKLHYDAIEVLGEITLNERLIEMKKESLLSGGGSFFHSLSNQIEQEIKDLKQKSLKLNNNYNEILKKLWNNNK